MAGIGFERNGTLHRLIGIGAFFFWAAMALPAAAQDLPTSEAPAEEPGRTEGSGTSGLASPLDAFLCPPLLDETGEPLTDEAGGALYDESVIRPVRDAEGNGLEAQDGAPLTEVCTVPTSDTPITLDSTYNAEAFAEAAEDVGPMGSVGALMEAGGPIIIILTVLAIAGLGVGLVKFVHFLWLGVGRRTAFVRRCLNEIEGQSPVGAMDELAGTRSPVARVMEAAIKGKSTASMEDHLVREETTRVAQAQLDGLERGLALLSLIATIAPLLGLLGTVLGMIEAFQQMETVGDRVEPAVLAGGIWEALLTTAAGLAVAIPAAVLFTWFQRMVDVEGQRMEDAATQVFTAPLMVSANDRS